MHELRRTAKVAVVGLLCTVVAACSSIETVNGVSLSSSRVENPCSAYPIVCIVGVGLIAGGAAVIIASKDNKSSSSAATVTTPTVTTPIVTTPTTPIVSDQRLKRDVRLVRTLENGVRLYAFRYIGDERIFVGVMAQELLGDAQFSSAVHMVESGFYAVDYAALGVDLLGAEQMKGAGDQALRKRS